MDGTAEEEKGINSCGQLCPALLWTKMPDVAVQIPLPFETEANERERVGGSWLERMVTRYGLSLMRYVHLTLSLTLIEPREDSEIEK